MVFQREQHSWLWPLSRAGKLGENKPQVEELWDLFDSAEKGLCREEAPAEFTRPVSETSRLLRFHIVRSADCREYRLFTDGADYLMTATFSKTEPRVDFSVDSLGEEDSEPGPMFSMTCSKDMSTWLLVQERGGTQTPSSPSTGSAAPQQVALIRHFCEDVGGGLARCMEVSLPAARCEHRRACAEVDLGAGRGVAQRLQSRLPEWDHHAHSLIMDFEGRELQSSAKNFQLADDEDRLVLQHAKIGGATFCLDFQAPLSIVQAFGAALTSAYWR